MNEVDQPNHVDTPLEVLEQRGVDPMRKVVFDEITVQETGARCLDGSSAGFYFRQAPVSASFTSLQEKLSKSYHLPFFFSNQTDSRHPNGFVIFMEGGGLCITRFDCQNRLGTNRGSSLNWPDTRSGFNGRNLIDPLPEQNPDF